jgi:hypothetical protein
MRAGSSRIWDQILQCATASHCCHSEKMDPSHLTSSTIFYSSKIGVQLAKCTVIKHKLRSSDSDWYADFGLKYYSEGSVNSPLQITRDITIHQSKWRGRPYDSVFPQLLHPFHACRTEVNVNIMRRRERALQMMKATRRSMFDHFT